MPTFVLHGVNLTIYAWRYITCLNAVLVLYVSIHSFVHLCYIMRLVFIHRYTVRYSNHPVHKETAEA